MIETYLNSFTNTIFKPEEDQTPCWSFCRLVYRMLGRNIPNSVWDMTRVETCELYSVALFKYSNDIWHTTVVWPDCLHFLHAVERPSGIYILKDRFSNTNLRLVKGYYVG